MQEGPWTKYAAPQQAPAAPAQMPWERYQSAPAAPASTPAPRRGGGRQPAPARQPVVRDEGEYSGALTLEERVAAIMLQGYGADDALRLAKEQEQYDDAATAASANPRRAGPESGAIIVEEAPLDSPNRLEAPWEAPAAAVADAYRRTPIGRQMMAAGGGMVRGVQRVAGGAYGLLGQAVDRLGLDGIGNAMINQADAYQARANEMNAPNRAANVLLNQTGQVAGEIAATAPVGMGTGVVIRGGGRALANVAPRVGRVVERVGEATMAGGFLPSAVRPPAAGAAPVLGERLANLALRGTGGGINAAAQTAVLSEEDTAAGAAIGALLPTVAARPAKYALNKLLEGFQVLSGSLGRSRASEIVRRSLGVDYDAAVAALRNAGPDVTAQQALVDAGVEPSAFMGVGAAVRGAEPDAFLAIEARQAAARQAPIDRLAGGENLTAAQLSARGEKAALRAAAVPMQQAELAAADASGALDVAPVTAALMQQADAPGVGTTNSRVLAEIASALDALAARRGGVASADDLYAFRKDDLDDIISRSLSGQRGGDITSQAARRSELVRSAQQMLDDAIEAAGGTGWRQYLDTYASGMRSVERQNMMGVAGGLLRENPNAFVRLAEGNAPDTVSGVFGGNRIDLANQMNPTGVGPSGMDALTDAARQIRRDERIGTLASEGQGLARELLRPGARRFNHTRNILSFGSPARAAAMDFASMLVDAKVAPQVRRALATAYQSGANMDELLAMVPLATRAQMQRNMMNPAFWSHLTGVGANAMATPE